MSLLRANVFSKSLQRTVDISVILPVENAGDDATPFKTLYLLHGVFGSDQDWLHYTRIRRWAEERNLAVVMPSGENSFYVDDPLRYRLFSQFVGEELVDLTRRMFNLSTNREDTFICGLSMGGFGAMRNGLKYNETFGYVGALSMGISTEMIDTSERKLPFASLEFFEAIYGDSPEVIRNTEHDLRYVIENLKSPLPNINIICGTEDLMFDANNMIHRTLVDNNIEHIYSTPPGSHDWDFWDKHIVDILNWLPLDKKKVVKRQGNVTK